MIMAEVDVKVLWENILQKLVTVANKQHLITYFRDTLVQGVSNGKLSVAVGLLVSRDFIDQRYNKIILDIAKEIDSSISMIEFELVPSIYNKEDPRKADVMKLLGDKAPTIRKVPNKQEVIVDGDMRSNIMKYSLENYITGSENRLVHAACMAVAAKPGSIYNPLYIYGEAGLGKTHLLQATGKEITKNYPKKRVIYMTAERFINEIIEAIGKRHTKPFKENYRNVDCLIIDDIQFFANKATSEQEFFHTFNELYDAGKQIIMSADKPPREINGLDSRLLTRFAMGMVIQVCIPEFETRVAILQKKCQEHGELIDPKVLEFIAENVTSSVREMIGVLIHVLAQAKLEQTTPTLKSVAAYLQQIYRHQRLVGYTEQLAAAHSLARQPIKNCEEVISLVANYYKIPKDELIGEERRKDIMVPRQICMYLIRKVLDQSYEAIGENFGGRNHTTVLHSCNKIEEQIKLDQRLMRDINTLRKEMGY